MEVGYGLFHRNKQLIPKSRVCVRHGISLHRIPSRIPTHTPGHLEWVIIGGGVQSIIIIIINPRQNLLTF